MTETTSTGQGPFAGTTIHTFVVDEQGGPRFVVIYGDADPAFLEGQSGDAVLDWFEGGNISATKGQQIAERHLTISGLPGREQRIVGPGGTYVFRTVLNGTRLYSVSVKGSEPQVNQADVIVYFDSFTISP